MTRNYPLNCWYVAAVSDEIGFEPMARRLLGRPVVMYRRQSDEVTALEDRCAHRGYPLSRGHVLGDDIVCGYHGCTYDPNGNCVRMPSQHTVPMHAIVASFPVVERPPFVWIWLGDTLAASLRDPPSLPWQSDEQWATSLEAAHVDANFLLLHEHYLDLTHMVIVHPETVPPGVAELPSMEDVEISETSVAYRRDLGAAPLAQWERRATRLPDDAQYARTEQGIFASPGLHVGRYTIHGDDGRAFDHLRTQAFTPECESATHVFLQIARNYSLDRDPLTTLLHTTFTTMAARDRQLLEVIEEQRTQASDAGRREVNVTADRAAIRARKIVAGLVADESGRPRLPGGQTSQRP